MSKILYIYIFFSFLLSSNLQNIEDLFYSGNVLDAQNFIEILENKDEKAYYLGYQIYMKLDDLNSANKYLQKALELNKEKYSDEGDELGQLINDLKNANKTLTSGFINEAIEESKVLINKYKDNSICYYRLGFAYKENKDFDNAIINFNKAIQLNPYNSKYKDEIRNISNVEMLKGKEAYDLKDYQMALDYFNKALEYDPSNSAAMFRIGNIYYAIKEYKKAANVLQDGLNINNRNYKVLYMVGKCYVAMNEYDKALDFFNKTIEVKSNYMNAYFEKAKLYKNLSDVDKTIETLDTILDIDSSYYKAYELLIDIEVSRNNLEQALVYGNKALVSSPNAYTILARMSAVYNEKTLYEKARDNAKLSLKSKKNYAPALFELGIAEMNLCNKLAAKDAFNKCKRDRNYRRTASDYLKPDNFDYYTKHCN